MIFCLVVCCPPWLKAALNKVSRDLLRFTAMIILHSHLQPQFKNESFHILHKVIIIKET